jgi:hypothetical protein
MLRLTTSLVSLITLLDDKITLLKEATRNLRPFSFALLLKVIKIPIIRCCAAPSDRAKVLLFYKTLNHLTPSYLAIICRMFFKSSIADDLIVSQSAASKTIVPAAKTTLVTDAMTMPPRASVTLKDTCITVAATATQYTHNLFSVRLSQSYCYIGRFTACLFLTPISRLRLLHIYP